MIRTVKELKEELKNIPDDTILGDMPYYVWEPNYKQNKFWLAPVPIILHEPDEPILLSSSGTAWTEWDLKKRNPGLSNKLVLTLGEITSNGELSDAAIESFIKLDF